MARDLRAIGTNRREYPDKCYYYDKNYINGNVVNKEAQPLGRFYKKDVVSFQWQKLDMGNGLFSNDNYFMGTIESKDHLENLRVGMYVKDNTGMIFKVLSPLVADDENKSKSVGTRPVFTYTIRLMGVEIK